MKYKDLSNQEQEYISKIIYANKELCDSIKPLIEKQIDRLSEVVANYFYYKEYEDVYLNTFLNETGSNAELFFELANRICKMVEDFGEIYFPFTASEEDGSEV